MLKLQHPHSMSRTAPLYRPFDYHPSQPKVQPALSTLPQPSSTSSHDFDRLTNNSRLPSLPSTPPSNMSFVSAAHGQAHIPSTQTASDVVRASGRSLHADAQTYLNSSLPHAAAHSLRTITSRPSSPTVQQPPQDIGHRRKPSENAIASQLQIPKTISTPQSSLLQLAAEITCLFWFESSSTLQEILRSGSPRQTLTVCAEAIPTTGFKKWVAMILSTTQVAQNVILLALLFVYRLKKINPGVKGKSGSEYRLLTVALMLGNKFLDDNTYTNKTWAEVSGISVLEVHMMEVEFLQNMKYNLFTSEKEWKDWHITLGKFGTFFDRALRGHLNGLPRTSTGPMVPIAHAPPSLAPTHPSTPTSHYASPPFAVVNRFSPNHHTYSNTPLLLPQVTSTVVSPIGPLPELDARAEVRKRSHDDSNLEPPPKRQIRQYPNNIDAPPTSLLPLAVSAPTLPRLPSLPSLSIPITQNLEVPLQLIPQLPLPGNRAMSLVYPPPIQWSQPASIPQQTASGPSSSPASGPLSGPQDHSRQLSPFPPSSVGNSPISATFPTGPGQSQGRLSPSCLLSQRQSPYRPVRRVNTLLYPPPTTIMQNPPRTISFDQMQYQALGRNERRPGPLPYMHHEAWPETNQLNQWPILPQPNIPRV